MPVTIPPHLPPPPPGGGGRTWSKLGRRHTRPVHTTLACAGSSPGTNSMRPLGKGAPPAQLREPGRYRHSARSLRPAYAAMESPDHWNAGGPVQVAACAGVKPCRYKAQSPCSWATKSGLGVARNHGSPIKWSQGGVPSLSSSSSSYLFTPLYLSKGNIHPTPTNSQYREKVLPFPTPNSSYCTVK